MPIFGLAFANYLLTLATNVSCSSSLSFGGGIGVLFSRLILAFFFVVGEVTLLAYLYYSHVLHKNGLESGY
ncbi:MAG: hypothetical protein A4S09_15790 [Proteobacteria bacterium SG_bin7]|nr:MAG: hypothetical protein A4S09_15790 [Proteobacteria bacterium SG_bin7]